MDETTTAPAPPAMPAGPRVLTPAEIRALRRELRLTQTDFATLLGVQRGTICRAEADGAESSALLIAAIWWLREYMRSRR